MRTMVSAIAVNLLCACLAVAGEDGAIRTPIHLDTPQDLAQLRATNLDHYARALRIIAAADRLCRPGVPQVQEAKLKARDVGCAQMLFASNPPMRRLSFTLDDTSYLALVTIRDDPPHLLKAR
jgi:hypothetical protein